MITASLCVAIAHSSMFLRETPETLMCACSLLSALSALHKTWLLLVHMQGSMSGSTCYDVLLYVALNVKL